MNNRYLEKLAMVGVVDEVLTKYEAVWSTSEPAARQVATIRSVHADLDDAQQEADTPSTGLTKQKNDVEKKLVDTGLMLAVLANRTHWTRTMRPWKPR